MFRKILWLLLFGFIIIQFIHPKSNKTKGDQPNYIGKVYPVPEKVHTILAKACFDCHSNNTRYPWYSNLQPADWWMAGHIRKGKGELNLDDFTSRSPRYQYNKMEAVADEVKKGDMPLNSYLWIHKDAKLSDEEKQTIMDWAAGVQDSLKAKWPMDSLLKKKRV